MNSDAERASRSRAAARRYLKLGREASTGLLRDVDAVLAGADNGSWEELERAVGRSDGEEGWEDAGAGVMMAVRDGGNAREGVRLDGCEVEGKRIAGSPGSLYDENGFYRGT